MLKDTLLLEYNRGHCPEIKSCGFSDSEVFPMLVNDYISNISNE